MHLSLKSAMSRIPYTNKVGETIGSIADSAAAYSLRALNGGDPTVVRVRRSSDDAERDFTVSDISGGALVDWVGSGNDGFVPVWYDQSGNLLDLINFGSTSQPKIVESGVFLNALDFLKADNTYMGLLSPANRVNGSHPAISPLSIQKLNFFSVFARSDTSSTQSIKSINFISEPSGLFRSTHITGYSPRTYERYFGGPTVLSDSISINESGANNIISSINQPTSEGGSSLHINGSEVSLGTTDVSGQIIFSRFAGSSVFNSSGINQTVSEFIIYDSDQSDNRSAIEANINNHYDIY